ncbi:MAG: hypothetical protein LLG01_02780 [Planctomycetaceae bacterium]|nr:hypothetical protein [Planctomycetaceae bacterium]
MSAITVSNVDWSIIAAVKAALAAAQVDAQAVFKAVTVTASRQQAQECQFVGPAPRVVVRYVTTAERTSPQDVRGCYVALELIVSAQVSPAADESQRVQEILRLANAAKNAVECSPPQQASAWGDSAYYHDAVRWGDVDLDVQAESPWIVCHLPVTIGFALETGTQH